MSFFGELSRRNVIRVGVAYGIVAWLILQVADIVLENIGAPAWVMQTLMLLLGLGFFIAAIFAWAYEVTPEGIKRESEIDRSQSITGVTGHKLNRVITGLLIVALAYFVWESRVADRPAAEPVAAAEPAAEFFEVTQTVIPDISVAVLPFENRSNREEDEFFTQGMHDDLLTTLAKIGSMKVISRTSVMEYRNTTKKIPEIATELGVANILEGGVQRSGSHVRINVQLIDAGTDEHLWAEIYDRELTAENLFAIQSEIARAIADALHATLSPEEETRVSTAPTDNLEAFDHYLRGRQLMAPRAVDELEEATREFQKAVEIDPQFALAWVAVADSHGLLGTYGSVLYGTYFDLRDRAINKALELDPNLGEAYASLGWLLGEKGETAAAEDAFLKAIRLSPNYATAYHWISNMLRRNLFRTEEALGYALRSAELDPNSAVIQANLTGIYGLLGDRDSYARSTNRLISMHPGSATAYSPAISLAARQGDLLGAIDASRKLVELDAGSAASLSELASRYAAIGAIDEARQSAQLLGERFANHPLVALTEISNALAAGESPDARPIISAILEDSPRGLTAYLAGYTALLLGQHDLALDAFGRATFEDLATVDFSRDFLGTQTGDLCYFSWALLETRGNEQRGRELLEKSIATIETGLPAGIRDRERFDAGVCYVLAGDNEKALDALEAQFAANLYGDWRWTLQLPLFDPLRDHPRFVGLQNQFDQLMAAQVSELRRRDKPAFEF